MPIEQFNPEQAANEVVSAIFPRYFERGMTQEQAQEEAQGLYNLSKIAGDLVMQGSGIPVAGTDQIFPYDDQNAAQIVDLFTEAMYFSAQKTQELGIPDELRPMFHQQAAQHVFEQAQQIVVSTFGQEHTPGLQFSREQQLEFVKQTAESALLHYVNEYEKENGPIIPDEQAVEQISKAQLHALQEEGLVQDPALLDIPVPPEESAAGSLIPLDSQTVMKGPSAYDKYAAVALLVATLPAEKVGAILKRFGAEEQEIIRYYSDPELVVQQLDVASVRSYLESFKQLLMQEARASASVAEDSAQSGESKYEFHPRLMALSQARSKEALCRLLTRERTAVQNLLENLFPEANEGEEPLFFPGETSSSRTLSTSKPLSPKIQEALCIYLEKRVS
ncbi:MAG: hypothetical protein K2X01_06690 [Cyanobacteria bacterium]|nr:hypothetical protein [Cyanobacteriota bacterium]